MCNILTFKHIVINLTTTINTLLHAYKTGNVSDEVWLGFYKAQLSSWFTQNWSNLTASAKQLSNNKTKHLQIIANVPITAYTSSNKNNNIPKSAALAIVLENLANALGELKLLELKTIFQDSYTNLVNYVQNNKPETKTAKTVVKKQASNTQQYTQLEETINNIISSLPKNAQSNARDIVLKNSNNKLKALIAFANSVK